MAPIIWKLVVEGYSRDQIAEELNARKIPTPRDRRWHNSMVGDMLRRTQAEFASDPIVAAAIELGPLEIRKRKRYGEVGPIVWKLRKEGRSLKAIADELNRGNEVTPARRKWNASTVRNFLIRTAESFAPSGRYLTLKQADSPAFELAEPSNKLELATPPCFPLTPGLSPKGIE